MKNFEHLIYKVQNQMIEVGIDPIYTQTLQISKFIANYIREEYDTSYQAADASDLHNDTLVVLGECNNEWIDIAEEIDNKLDKLKR